MRLTSTLFVAQILRRVFADGGFAAVVRHGAESAGAIFLTVRMRDGTVRLYAPAAQMLAGEDGDRRFMEEPPLEEAALARRFEREARFDPDFWIVELETDDPGRYLDIVRES